MASLIKKIFFCLGLFSVFFPILASAEYTLEVSLPGAPAAVSDPGVYVRYLFIFGLSLAGFLAVGAVAVGGVQHMLSSSVGSAQKSKELIYGALMGMGLLLGSYLLLYTIDPSLTNLSPKVPSAVNISKPAGFAAPAPGTKNCDPACAAGYTCNNNGQTYACAKIEVTDPQMIKNQTPGQCQEYEAFPSGCAMGHKVWNSNSCQCEGCGDYYKWDYSTKKCAPK